MTSKALRNLDLNLLVVFEAIYASGSISEASERLCLTQPAVSNALARLRTLLDDPLFVRVRHGMAPTPKAQRMIRPVRDALAILGSQVEKTRDDDLSGYDRHVRILLSDAIEAVVMPPLLRDVASTMPRATIETVSALGRSFADELIAGTLELAAYVYPVTHPDIVTVPLGAIDFVIVARRNHPAFQGPIGLEQFARLGHIMLPPELRSTLAVEQSIAAKGETRNPAYTVAKVWAWPPIVARTDLIAALPRWYAAWAQQHFDIEIHESPVKISEQHIYLTWHVRHDDDAGHRWLRERILAHFHAAEAAARPPAAVVGRRVAAGR